MIIGTLMFDVEIEVADEKELGELTSSLVRTAKTIKGIQDIQEVDLDIEEDSEKD